MCSWYITAIMIISHDDYRFETNDKLSLLYKSEIRFI